MPDSSRIPHIDRQRPECVALDNRIKQRRVSLARFRQQLQQTQDLEEREEILRNIDALSEEIDALREELGFAGCYIIDVPQRNMFLKVIGIEATQSTQYFSIEGTGAGPDNSIRFIENKQMLVRVYIRNTLLEAVTMTGRLSMYAFNANTLKYDVLRKQVRPDEPGQHGCPVGFDAGPVQRDAQFSGARGGLPWECPALHPCLARRP